jgi:hypothetical protein
VTGIARSLLEHPCFGHVAPFVTVEAGTLLATGRKHRRIELRTERLSDAQIAKVLGVRVACASCGQPISPFRRRRGKSAGRAERPGRLFVALTCSLAESIGCSRGQAATEAYEHLIRALGHHSPPEPPPAASARATLPPAREVAAAQQRLGGVR